MILFYVGKPDDQFLTRCPPKRSCLDSMNTPYSTTTHLPMSVAEQSSEIKIGGSCGGERGAIVYDVPMETVFKSDRKRRV